MAKPDPQRDRVYDFESGWSDWNRSTFSLSEARETVHWACKKYGLKPPAVKQHGGREYSYSQGNVISFRRDQVNPAIALHEAAHYICDAIFGNAVAHHSPEWAGIYFWLLEGARLVPRAALHAAARAKKVRWMATWAVSPKRLRRNRRVARIS